MPIKVIARLLAVSVKFSDVLWVAFGPTLIKSKIQSAFKITGSVLNH